MPRLIALLFASALSFYGLANTAFDPKQLETLAEVDGYGYKTSNLILLKGLLGDPQLMKGIAPVSVAVPEFIGLTSDEVEQVLNAAGVDLRAEWGRIIATTVGYNVDDVMQASLVDKTLPAEFIGACQALAHSIRQAFARLSQHPNIENTKLTAFLKQASAANWRLMARSTGKEDTEKLANAGGNRSEANLSPNMSSILTGIGSVVSSYFEMRSLSQRMIAGDTTIFDLPLSPVLIQRMVGEELGGSANAEQIPSGCVVYSVEPAGYSPESDRKETRTNTLQCAFGHNEGVVQSLISLDTFYVPPSGMIKSIIKAKTKRLVPFQDGESFGLRQASNPGQIQKLPALKGSVILAIGKIATRIDEFYDKRMDIELAYIPKDNTVYVFQARPLVFKARRESPSYLNNIAQFDPTHVVPFISINPGDAAVQVLTDPHQWIISPTLKAALDRYTRSSREEKAKLVGVVAKSEVDATSHEAATFRGDGKIIVQATKTDVIEGWIKAKKPAVAFDVQRGVAIDLRGTKLADKSVNELTTLQEIKSGWINYPLPMIVSVGMHDTTNTCAPTETGGFAAADRCQANEFDEAIVDFSKQVAEMRKMASCNAVETDCLREKLAAQQTLEKMERLLSHAKQVAQEIKQSPSEADLLSRLLPKRFLEALIHQDQENDGLHTYSFASVTRDHSERLEKIDRYLLPLVKTGQIAKTLLLDDTAFSLAEAGISETLTDEVGKAWLHWLNVLKRDASPNDLAQLKEMVAEMSTLGIFAAWLNSQFSFSPEQNALEALTKYRSAYDASKARLDPIIDIVTRLDSYDPSVWSKRKNFAANMKAMKAIFEEHFSGNMPEKFLESLAITIAKEKFVAKFDLSIKALKSNPHYGTMDELLTDFRTVVLLYLDVLRNWHNAMPTKFPFADEKFANLDAKLEHRDDPGQNDLLGSEYFRVDLARIGAGTGHGSGPSTFEDIFTFVHQSLLDINQYYLVSIFWQNKILKIPQHLERMIVLSGLDHVPRMTGVEMNKGTITFKFHVPLRWHSAFIEFQYNRATDQVDMRYVIDSSPREAIAEYAAIWSSLHGSQTIAEGNGFITRHCERMPLNELVAMINMASHMTLGNKPFVAPAIALMKKNEIPGLWTEDELVARYTSIYKLIDWHYSGDDFQEIIEKGNVAAQIALIEAESYRKKVRNCCGDLVAKLATSQNHRLKAAAAAFLQAH